ncbi:MAG TPA: SgcJ/EcaC family oxidoreductase [Streptosporangiaceae bacterium]|jgi:uncharacterized protein (TIGR02246 family)|nr:SgcJ/EcaC family oxidoreductase [Streptosporangiaceae bacterium]
MTTNSTTALPASQDAAIRAVFEQTSRAWADGDADAFAARYAPEATVIMPGRYLPGRDAIRTAMAAAFAGPLRGSRRIHRVQAIRFTDPGTAIVITDSITALPGEPEPPVQQHERVTWVLSRHDGHWLVEAYHSSPKHAGPSGRLPRTR